MLVSVSSAMTLCMDLLQSASGQCSGQLCVQYRQEAGSLIHSLDVEHAVKNTA